MRPKYLSLFILIAFPLLCISNIGRGFKAYSILVGRGLQENTQITELYYDQFRSNRAKRINYSGIGLSYMKNNTENALGLRLAYDPLGWGLLLSRNIKFYTHISGEVHYTLKSNLYSFKPGLGVLGNFFERSPVQIKTSFAMGLWVAEEPISLQNSFLELKVGLGINIWRIRSIIYRKKMESSSTE